MSVFTMLVVAGAVATGLAGGVLFAFSTFVLGGLRRLPAAAAVVGLVGGEPGAGRALAGAVVALVGILGVTAVGNVPLNERLDAAAARPQDLAAAWAAFLPRWLAWNHVRTVAGAAATALLALALV
ncbi:anthrone oxygenase family protein [Cellulosimicrobium sp. NPDC055967]|uniref:anthrone oxygenase family protein n=1 Tax=Cellulosimicrobium sp. NPDC055967 TaxID=3345670 RepID=UPI0035DFFD67